jgi:hypothetical protein
VVLRERGDLRSTRVSSLGDGTFRPGDLDRERRAAGGGANRVAEPKLLSGRSGVGGTIWTTGVKLVTAVPLSTAVPLLPSSDKVGNKFMKN